MTAHSPAGLDPQRFGVDKDCSPPGTFANNDLIPIDRIGCNHETFSEGLKKSLYNYMHNICFDFPLQEWFDFRIPRTTIAPNFIRNIVTQVQVVSPAPHSRIIWLGVIPTILFYTRTKKGKSAPAAKIIIQTNRQELTIMTGEQTGRWLSGIFSHLTIGNHPAFTFRELEEQYQAGGLGDFKAFWEGPVAKRLRENGLVVV